MDASGCHHRLLDRPGGGQVEATGTWQEELSEHQGNHMSAIPHRSRRPPPPSVKHELPIVQRLPSATPSTHRRSLRPTAAASTFGQPLPAMLRPLDGPCDPGDPSAGRDRRHDFQDRMDQVGQNADQWLTKGEEGNRWRWSEFQGLGDGGCGLPDRSRVAMGSAGNARAMGGCWVMAAGAVDMGRSRTAASCDHRGRGGVEVAARAGNP